MLTEARNNELEGNLKNAVSSYEQILKEEPHNENILHRLMILYRKLKQPKKEIAIINKAIRLEENKYTPSRKPVGVAAEISKKINKMIGLSGKNGVISKPETIVRLEKRKEIVLKKNK